MSDEDRRILAPSLGYMHFINKILKISDVILMHAQIQPGKEYLALLPHRILLNYALENITHPEDYRKVIQYSLKIELGQMGGLISFLSNVLHKGRLTAELVTEVIQSLKPLKSYDDVKWSLLIGGYFHLFDEETIKDIIKTTAVPEKIHKAGWGKFQILNLTQSLQELQYLY